MELIHVEDERTNQLIEYLRTLGSGVQTKENFQRYAAVLSDATAFEVNSALHQVLSDTTNVDSWKVPVARFLRSVAQSLESAPLPTYPEGHPLAILEAENTAILSALTAIQAVAKEGGSWRKIQKSLSFLKQLGAHYERLQNELFPLIENASRDHACVKLMWSIQDSNLILLNNLRTESPNTEQASFITDFGKFYLEATSLAWRERYILFPIAMHSISEAAFINKPAQSSETHKTTFTCETGALSSIQLDAIFKALPVDISFIGPDDRVKFYSNPPHRIFPRSPQIIGRLVQNCHPPKSVDTVERILESFKNGTADTSEFYLTINDRFIHITYTAVRDPFGTYLGTIESSQDATHLRALTGEKRLL